MGKVRENPRSYREAFWMPIGRGKGGSAGYVARKLHNESGPEFPEGKRGRRSYISVPARNERAMKFQKFLEDPNRIRRRPRQKIVVPESTRSTRFGGRKVPSTVVLDNEVIPDDISITGNYSAHSEENVGQEVVVHDKVIVEETLEDHPIPSNDVSGSRNEQGSQECVTEEPFVANVIPEIFQSEDISQPVETPPQIISPLQLQDECRERDEAGIQNCVSETFLERNVDAENNNAQETQESIFLDDAQSSEMSQNSKSVQSNQENASADDVTLEQIDPQEKVSQLPGIPLTKSMPSSRPSLKTRRSANNAPQLHSSRQITAHQECSEFLAWTHKQLLMEYAFCADNEEPEHHSWEIKAKKNKSGKLRVALPLIINAARERFKTMESPSKEDYQRVLECIKNQILIVQSLVCQSVDASMRLSLFQPGSFPFSLCKNYYRALPKRLFSTRNYGKVSTPDFDQVVSATFTFLKNILTSDHIPGAQFPHFLPPSSPVEKEGQIMLDDLSLPKDHKLEVNHWSPKRWANKYKHNVYGKPMGVSVSVKDMLDIRPGCHVSIKVIDVVILKLLKDLDNLTNVQVVLPSISTELFEDEKKLLKSIGPSVQKLLIPTVLGSKTGVGHFVVFHLDTEQHAITIYNPLYKNGHPVSQAHNRDKRELKDKLAVVERLGRQLSNNDDEGPVEWSLPSSFTKPSLLSPLKNKTDGGVLAFLYIELQLREEKGFKNEKLRTEREIRLLKNGILDCERQRIFVTVRDCVIDLHKSALIPPVTNCTRKT